MHWRRIIREELVKNENSGEEYWRRIIREIIRLESKSVSI